MYLIEATCQPNAFLVIPEGIKGQTRKSAINCFCEFKGLKLNCWEEGEKRRLIILVWLADGENALFRTMV
jgi:hypothetical protein